MEEVKIVWCYNPADGNKLIGSKVVDQNYKLSDGETFVTPGDGLYEPIRFDLATQVWVGVSKAEWEADHPAPAPKPTPQQTLMAGVMKDLAGVKQDGQSQDKLNADMMKQVAKLTIANNAKDKLTAQLTKDVAALKIKVDGLSTQLSKAAQPTQAPTQPTEVQATKPQTNREE